jgi:hypothetical protein
VSVVARQLGQVEHRDLFLGQDVAIGLLLGVDVADARHPTPDELRHTKRLVILRNEQRKAWSRVAHSSNLRAKHVDVHVGRHQKYILDLMSDLAAADRLAAQRLERDPVAHRMRQDIDLFHVAIGCQRIEELFQRIARIDRALPVVGIGVQPQLAARGPGEQHRYAFGRRVVHDLRKPVDRIVEPIVEAVHEDQHFASPALLGGVGDGGGKRALVEMVRADGDEIARGRSRQPRQLDAAAAGG